MTYVLNSKQTHCQLMLVLFTNILGSRANAGVSLCCLAPPWCIYISKIHIWRLQTPKLNSPKDLIRVSGATPSRCTYVVHLFDQISEKALSDFMPEYLVPEFSTWKFYHIQGISRSPSMYSFAKHSGGCWWGLVPRVPPCIYSGGPRRGLLWLDPPSERF
jgi:hypothetical protein